MYIKQLKNKRIKAIGANILFIILGIKHGQFKIRDSADGDWIPQLKPNPNTYMKRFKRFKFFTSQMGMPGRLKHVLLFFNLELIVLWYFVYCYLISFQTYISIFRRNINGDTDNNVDNSIT